MTDFVRRLDRRRDRELGAALARALATHDEAAFVARVVARLDARRVAAAWETLAGWAGRGVAAAVLVVLLSGLAARSQPASGPSLDTALVGIESRLLLEPATPDAGLLLELPTGP